jgi:hypothetical protein
MRQLLRVARPERESAGRLVAVRRGDAAIRVLITIGATSLVAAAALHVATFFPLNGAYLGVGQWILVVPMVVVFGGAILAGTARRPRIEIPDRGPGLAIAVAVLALFVYAGINFFVTLLPGQPGSADGSYYFNIHGSRIPISREQYEEALRFQVRLFTGHMLPFAGAGTALLLATLGKSATVAPTRPAVAIDLDRRRMDLAPRARLVLGVFGVLSALVVGFWLLSGPIQGGGATIWVVAVLAITLFNVIRYWRWIAQGRAERSEIHDPSGKPPGA